MQRGGYASFRWLANVGRGVIDISFQSCGGLRADYTRSRAGPGAAWLPHWPSQLWWGLVDWGGGRQHFTRLLSEKTCNGTCNEQKPDKK